MSERDFDVEEKEALISMCIERCTFEYYHVPDTKFLVCFCVTPSRVVIASGYAQRLQGDYIAEVAREYATQNCRNGARDVLWNAPHEQLLAIVNG